jgi:hypothetical protein
MWRVPGLLPLFYESRVAAYGFPFNLPADFSQTHFYRTSGGDSFLDANSFRLRPQEIANLIGLRWLWPQNGAGIELHLCLVKCHLQSSADASDVDLYRPSADRARSLRAQVALAPCLPHPSNDQIDVRFLGKDVAVVHASSELLGDARTPDPRRTLMTFVLTRENGGWLIAAAQNTEINRTVK